MNVKELITALQECEPEADVEITFTGDNGPLYELNGLFKAGALNNADKHFIFLEIGTYPINHAPSPFLKALLDAATLMDEQGLT